jgi:2-polyprenyl-3-methyl-5-hydroxy-6-metoxy-1,4-benzoquinol methylase
MKPLDRFLQRWRIDKVEPLIPEGARVLDIGCADGALFHQLEGKIAGGVGIDPTLDAPTAEGKFRYLPGHFPDAVPDGETFDVITALAILEHVPDDQQRPFAEGCARHLKQGGRLLITVPGPLVDKILDVLMALKILDGMAAEEHHGFEPHHTPGIFNPVGLKLIKHAKFQLGLNNFYAFEKRAD